MLAPVRPLASAAAALVLATSSAATVAGGPPSPALVGKTVLLAPRTKTSGCKLGANPDRRCSPGAYYSKLTKAVLCAGSFRKDSTLYVPESEKHAVEIAYGLAPKSYGPAIEIDHIVPLEIGGSNNIANLFPERADAHPGFPIKDLLENSLHTLVCAGAMTIGAAQSRVAKNWQALYKTVFGMAPIN